MKPRSSKKGRIVLEVRISSNIRRSLQVLCDQSGMDSDDVITGLIHKERWGNKSSREPVADGMIAAHLFSTDERDPGAIGTDGTIVHLPAVPRKGEGLSFKGEYYKVYAVAWEIKENGTTRNVTVYIDPE